MTLMPSHLPSSFASAAAGQNRDTRSNGRFDMPRGVGSGDWSRRDGRSANGTRTFRRPSTTPLTQPTLQSPETLLSPTVQPTGFEELSTPRYSKDNLLEIFKSSTDSPAPDISSLLMAGWNPPQINGGSNESSWVKIGELMNASQNPTLCWDSRGIASPVGLHDLSDEERELFISHINSLPKATSQNKDGAFHQNGSQNARRMSTSHGNASSNFNLLSPSHTVQPAARRRDTAEINSLTTRFLSSPTWLAHHTRKGHEKMQLFDEPEEEELDIKGLKAAPDPSDAVPRTTSGASEVSGPSYWGNSATTPTLAGVGSFGKFALPNSAVGDKRFGSSRGESRLAHLMQRDLNDLGARANDEVPAPESGELRTHRQLTDHELPSLDDALAGNTAFAAESRPRHPLHFSRASDFDSPIRASTAEFGMTNFKSTAPGGGASPTSPTETNPYRSPPAERTDDHGDGSVNQPRIQSMEVQQAKHTAQSGRSFGLNSPELRDESQTPGASTKAYPNLTSLTGWPSGLSANSNERDRPGYAFAFGNSIFNPGHDLQSPRMPSALGGLFGAPVSMGSGGSARASKPNPLLPQVMQTQLQGHDQEALEDMSTDFRLGTLGVIGRTAQAGPPRDTESPIRANRNLHDESYPSTESARTIFSPGEHHPASFTSSSQAQGFTAATAASGFSATHNSTEPPSLQTRTMVMPDRMRWVYLDPQGHMQGPFTGLEMNDWYKANFFTPDLRVKKVEDPEFEPLGQLIRRIGNSREPFLVPQIGIPHGPPSQSGPFATGDSRGVVPPLVGAFPSFGRTLTAEEQNNLERRKQEEQYLMARQREYLAQHQAFHKFQMPGIGTASASLHHHSSAHSLQSQPSFSSMASPIGITPQAPIGTICSNSAFFDTLMTAAQPTGRIGGVGTTEGPRDELNLQDRPLPANYKTPAAYQGAVSQSQSTAASPASVGLRSQLPSVDQLSNDSMGFSARLKEFHEIRAQRDAEDASSQSNNINDTPNEAADLKPSFVAVEGNAEVTNTKGSVDEPQVQLRESQDSGVAPAATDETEVHRSPKAKTSQAVASEKHAQPDDKSSKKGRSDAPRLFPPPPAAIIGSPVASPSTTRPSKGQDSNEQGSSVKSPAETPVTTPLQPPPAAPWARELEAATHRRPSLKEIQEAEAKKAAKAEEAAAAARKSALEQESVALREREKATATAVSGLPTTSTWGIGSVSSNTRGANPWAKAAATKASSSGPANSSSTASKTDKKQTLAEIQREEEARKQKAKELAMHSNTSSSVGKRYADLATKASGPPGLSGPIIAATVSPSQNSSSGGRWATVGAGGKVKVSSSLSTQAWPANVNSNAETAPPTAKATPKPVASSSKDTGSAAMDEFNKWLRRELGRGLSGTIDTNTFAANLLEVGLDATILSEAIYANSSTMDGRHFAEEFIRRKQLADMGIVEKQPISTATSENRSGGNGGWSEVSKRGGNSNAHKEEPTIPGAASFKVVSARKKGKK